MKSLRAHFTIGFGLLLTILLAVVLLVLYALYNGVAAGVVAGLALTRASDLKWTLLIVFIVVVLIGWLAAWWFAKRVLRPLGNLKHNIQHISPDNLHGRIAQNEGVEEVDALANHFNQMLDRVQNAFARQKEFLHYASHELRTPIASMVSLTESSLDRGYAADKLEQVLRQLLQQQTNLANITNSLLLLTDRKPTDNTYPRIRIDELVFRSVEVVQQLYPTAHIQVDLDVDGPGESALLVKASEPLLMIAFSNLLKNAIQYSDNNAAIVILRLQEATKEVIFKNTGELFSPDEQELIYEPFYRGKNARKKSGHGLGLAIVKQIADIHQAEIKYHHDGFNIFSFCFSDNNECADIKPIS